MVNNAIVLPDFIQQEETEGSSRQEIQKSLQSSFTSDLLTSLTTIFECFSLGLGEGRKSIKDWEFPLCSE